MSVDQYYWCIQYNASYHGCTLLQNVHSCDEHVLMWTLEQVSQQGDPASITDSLLVLGALAAASQCQQCTASHLHIPSFLCGQVGQVRDFLQYLNLRTETQGSLSSELWSNELWAVTVSELNVITAGMLIHHVKASGYEWGTFRNYVDVVSMSPV